MHLPASERHWLSSLDLATDPPLRGPWHRAAPVQGPAQRMARPFLTSHHNASETVLLSRLGTDQPSASTPATNSGKVSGPGASSRHTQIAGEGPSRRPCPLPRWPYQTIRMAGTAIVAQTPAGTPLAQHDFAIQQRPHVCEQMRSTACSLTGFDPRLKTGARSKVSVPSCRRETPDRGRYVIRSGVPLVGCG